MKRKIGALFKIKYVLMLLTIILLGSIVITYSFGGNIASYKNGIASFFSPLRETASNIKNYFAEASEEKKSKEELELENAALEKENQELKAKLEKYQSDIYLLDEYKELLKLQEDYSQYESVVATVIAKNTGNWLYEFTIDKGTNDGIAIDMNVVADGGLAGIVVDVGSNYSVVKTILADDMNVSAISSTTRDTCIVSGDLELLSENVIRVMYIHKDAKIKDYDRLITSSTSNKYLPYILIGYVHDMEVDNNDLTMSGLLTPAVDFQHLENVLVIKKLKSDLTAE